MSTALVMSYTPTTTTNLDQTITVNEGDLTAALLPIVMTPNNSYNNELTATFVISGTSQAASILMVCSILNGLPFTRSGNTYTLSSVKVVNGVRINNWPYFQLALQHLSLQFTNSDINENFNIAITITTGTLSSDIQSGNIVATVNSVPDSTGLFQTLNTEMASNLQTFVQAGGAAIVLNDPDQATRTYRVTYEVHDGFSAGAQVDSNMYVAYPPDYAWSKAATFTGTQAQVNTFNAQIGVLNDNFFYYGPGAYISYKQEVITTTQPGVTVPYIQETGQINVNVAYTAPYTAPVPSAPTYPEDDNAHFNAGQITDKAGENWAHETCGLYSGGNCYTVTITSTNTFTPENPISILYSGDPSIDSTLVLQGTRDEVNAILTDIIIWPPADYTAPINLNIKLERGNTPVVLSNTPLTLTCSLTHPEFYIIPGGNFVLGTNALNIGSITDAAFFKQYNVTLTFTTATFATLDATGTGGTVTWNPTGGAGGFGQLTLTGSRDELNGRLNQIVLTTTAGATINDTINIAYHQTQTTNNVDQGGTSLVYSNIFIWAGGNDGGQFRYDENTKTTFDLGAISTAVAAATKVEIGTSVPFSVANGGSLTGWTKVSDTLWSFTGDKAAINAKLAAVEFVPPADLKVDYNVGIKLYNGATVLYDSATSGSPKTFKIRTTYPYFSSVPSIQLHNGLNQYSYSVGSITDVRPENINPAITYQVELTPTNLTQITALSSTGTGGTSTWASNKLTITGTKVQVNSHLSNVTVTYVGTSTTTIGWTQIQTTNVSNQGSALISAEKMLPQFAAFGYANAAFTEDQITWEMSPLAYPTATESFGYNSNIFGSFNKKWAVYSNSSLTNSSTAKSNLRSGPLTWDILTQESGVSFRNEFSPGTFLGTAVANNKRVSAWRGVYTAPGAGILEGVGIISSSDDITSVNVKLANPASFNSQTYANVVQVSNIVALNGNFYINVYETGRVNNSPVYQIIVYSSSDAVNWTKSVVRSHTASVANKICTKEITYNTNSTYAIPYTFDQTLYSATSVNGTSWTSNLISVSSNVSTTLQWNGTYWLTIGINTTSSGSIPIASYVAYKSTDGVNWTSSVLSQIAPTSASENTWRTSTLAHGNGAWVFIDANKVFNSPDGVTWTAAPGFTNYATMYSVKFINGLFYLMASFTNNNSRLLTSLDGVNWSLLHTFPPGDNWPELIYQP